MLKSIHSSLGLEYVEVGTSTFSPDVLEKLKPTESRYSNTTIFRKHLESSYSVIFINLANKLNFIGAKKIADENKILNLSYSLTNYFKKVTPYLVNENYLAAISLLCGHVDFVTIDLTGSSISNVKFDNPQNLRTLLEQLSVVVDNNSESGSKLKLLFRIDLVELMNRVGNESSVYNILDELYASKVMYGIVLDSNIIAHDGFKVFNDELNVKRLLESLELISRYKSNRTSSKLKIITSDGVRNGQDISNYYKKGADFVTFSSLFMTEGPFCIERLSNELRTLL